MPTRSHQWVRQAFVGRSPQTSTSVSATLLQEPDLLALPQPTSKLLTPGKTSLYSSPSSVLLGAVMVGVALVTTTIGVGYLNVTQFDGRTQAAESLPALSPVDQEFEAKVVGYQQVDNPVVRFAVQEYLQLRDERRSLLRTEEKLLAQRRQWWARVGGSFWVDAELSKVRSRLVEIDESQWMSRQRITDLLSE